METITFKSESEAGLQAVTEEELFCDYLAARVQQALDALNEARSELTGKPQDFAQAAQVMRRVQELRDLKKQWELQCNRVDTARTAAGMEPLVREAATNGTAEFRTVQAEQAARIMTALAASPRTCPSCQTPLANDAEQCGCGRAVSNPDRQNTSTSPHEPLA